MMARAARVSTLREQEQSKSKRGNVLGLNGEAGVNGFSSRACFRDCGCGSAKGEVRTRLKGEGGEGGADPRNWILCGEQGGGGASMIMSCERLEDSFNMLCVCLCAV
jgi:hypothetical protein